MMHNDTVVRVLSGPYDSACSSVGDVILAAPRYECKHPWADLLAAQVMSDRGDAMQLAIVGGRDAVADRWGFPSLALLWQDQNKTIYGSILIRASIVEMDVTPHLLGRTTIIISWVSARALRPLFHEQIP